MNSDLGSVGVVALLSATVASIACTFLLVKFCDYMPMDRPNHRSLHSVPVPRTGGIAILAGTIVATCIAQFAVRLDGLFAPLILALILAMLSFLDDVRGLSIKIRFLLQLLASAIVVLPHAGVQANLGLFMFCALAIAWMTNVYNFMDGSDGLAGGMTVIGFGAYAFGAWTFDSVDVMVLSFAIVGSGIGFLIFNFHPARIFMGDVGSVPLGFLAGAIGMVGWLDGLWPLGFPAVVFSPFLVDATFTLVRRLISGKPPWQAHREHCYQRIILMGLGHRNTALFEYAAMLICGVGGLVLLRMPELQFTMAICWLVGYAILIGMIEITWRDHVPGPGDR